MSVAPAPGYYVLSAPMEGTWRSPGYRSARMRANCTMVVFGFLMVAAIALLLAHWNEVTLLNRIEAGDWVFENEVLDSDNLVGGAAGWCMIFTIPAAICFLAWLSRSVDNAPPLLAGTPLRSPRESIGWWFVPIANLYLPYQIVRELFERLATPQRAGGRGKVVAWWVLFVGSAIASVVAGIVTSNADVAESVRPLRDGIALWLAADTVSIVGIAFAMWLVHEMQGRADTRAAGLGLSNEGVGVWPARPYGMPPWPPYPSAPWPYQPAAAPMPPVYPTSPVPYAPPMTQPVPGPLPPQMWSGAAPASPSPAPLPAAAEEAPTAYCPRCSHPLVASLRFCAQCGFDRMAAPVASTENISTSEPSRTE